MVSEICELTDKEKNSQTNRQNISDAPQYFTPVLGRSRPQKYEKEQFPDHRGEAAEVRGVGYLGRYGVDVDEKTGCHEELQQPDERDGRRQDELDKVAVTRRAEAVQRRGRSCSRRLRQHLQNTHALVSK